jgi:hypothetical protein
MFSMTILLTPVPLHAVNFATGAKAAPGFLLNLYPYYYLADKQTDKNGDTIVSNLGLRKYGVHIGNSYYVGDFLLNAIIPVGKLKVGAAHDSDSGLGDIQLRAGWFLPVDSLIILPVFMVKVPTGNFDKNNTVNFGDGQTDVAAELYLYKLYKSLSFDALLRYTVRFKNQDTGITPGNEFTAETLLTWRLAEKFRIGPAINFITGDDLKKSGVTLSDSGLTRLSVGGEVYYGRISQAKISLAAYSDVLTRNTRKGLLIMSRIMIRF